MFGWLMGEIVLPSDGSAGEIVGVSTVIAGSASGEPKTGVNSLFGPVIVSIRSAKQKRQDLTHKTIIIENANSEFSTWFSFSSHLHKKYFIIWEETQPQIIILLLKLILSLILSIV